MADLWIVRLFELVCVLAEVGGIAWVVRMHNPVYAGAYFGSSTLMLFDWIFNTNWFFRVVYDEKLLPLWKLQGVVEPLAIACNYAFFFGVPVLFFVHHREKLDKRVGLLGSFLAVCVFAVGLDAAFEIPMVKYLKIWKYYQEPKFLVGGVPYSNLWFSGLLMTTSYGAVRLAVRWASLPRLAVASAGLVPVGMLPLAVVETTREQWWRGFLFGTAALWSAFYLSSSLQFIWYTVMTPWIAAPRPF